MTKSRCELISRSALNGMSGIFVGLETTYKRKGKAVTVIRALVEGGVCLHGARVYIQALFVRLRELVPGGFEV